jgi:mannose-6-phosphate isomerase-like protein (cupin superfamily)
MIKYVVGLTVTAATVLTVSMAVQSQGSSAMYVGKDKIEAAFLKGGAVVLDYGAIPGAPDFSIAGGHRDKAGVPEWHQRDTEVMYFVEGTATIVTGGTLEGAKETRPGHKSGGTIKGGQTHRMAKGDALAIPAQTPHWFKEVSSPVSYYVSRVQK